ncbi:MAG: DinB family protein [Blastocatellia bacterium]|nr:DinB family protein [Blastocatellia bacterium]
MAGDSELQSVKELIRAGEALTQEAQASFGQLNPAQLNWKPNPEQWSIGQCFDHLITTNGTYFPVVEALLAGTRTLNIWERLGVFSKAMGNWLLNALKEDPAKKKFAAPPAFRPTSSRLEGNILERFAQHQKCLLELMKRTEPFDLEQTIISSPALKPMTYSLMDAYRIIITHERRHLRQALRVMESPDFPRN